MLSSFLILPALLLCFYLLQNILCLLNNVAKAKRAGFTYSIVPIYRHNLIWNVAGDGVGALLRALLPYKWIQTFLYWCPNYHWHIPFHEYERKGTMTAFVGPGGMVVDIADAEAITQITARRNDFRKPLELYGVLDVFGKNMLTVEGALWRLHRKITQPSFSERNNRVVWAEALHQGQAMVESWLRKGSMGAGLTSAVHTLEGDHMRLSLAVISKAGFGRKILWPFEEEEQFGSGDEGLPAGHDMSYTESMDTLLRNILVILIIPAWLRAILPMKKVRLAHKASVEWSAYLRDIYVQKKADIENGKGDGDLDLMGALVRGTEIAPTLPEAAAVRPELDSIGCGWGTPTVDPKNLFSENEVFGNAYFFLIAGHETVAHTLHYALILLALHPSSQQELQRELDDIFGDTPVSEWNYDVYLPKLSYGMTAAIMNESMRLLPPVVGIPKCAVGEQQLTFSSGKKMIVPAGCQLTLVTSYVHRNPRYWPRLDEDDARDLYKFKPRRWLDIKSTNQEESLLDKSVDSEDPQIDGPWEEAENGSSQKNARGNFYNPPKGAYLPFSEGPRACMGRRFAQVEAFAVLAVIFRHFSVELDLAVMDSTLGQDARAYDENLKGRSGEERCRLWSGARDRAVDVFEKKLAQMITLQMVGGNVPIRMVQRGKERLSREEMDEGMTAGF